MIKKTRSSFFHLTLFHGLVTFPLCLNPTNSFSSFLRKPFHVLNRFCDCILWLFEAVHKLICSSARHAAVQHSSFTHLSPSLCSLPYASGTSLPPQVLMKSQAFLYSVLGKKGQNWPHVHQPSVVSRGDTTAPCHYGTNWQTAGKLLLKHSQRMCMERI